MVSLAPVTEIFIVSSALGAQRKTKGTLIYHKKLCRNQLLLVTVRLCVIYIGHNILHLILTLRPISQRLKSLRLAQSVD